MKKYEEVTKRIQDNNKRYWAGDNISEYIFKGEKEALIEEATEASWKRRLLKQNSEEKALEMQLRRGNSTMASVERQI